MIGATFTPTCSPARASVSMTRSRRAGVATYGSIARARSGSQNGMLTVTKAEATRASSVNTSTSRSISADLVMIAAGFACATQTSRHARVNRYDASSGW